MVVKAEESVIMQMARVQIAGTGKLANILFDTGSDRTWWKR